LQRWSDFHGWLRLLACCFPMSKHSNTCLLFLFVYKDCTLEWRFCLTRKLWNFTKIVGTLASEEMHLLTFLRKLLKWRKEMSLLQSKYKNYPGPHFYSCHFLFCFTVTTIPN
jgi:hypothetical protein